MAQATAAKPKSAKTIVPEEYYGEEIYNEQIVRRLLGYITPQRRLIFLGMVATIIIAGISLASPYLIKVAIDSGISARNVQLLGITMVLYVVLHLIQWLAVRAQILIMTEASQNTIHRIRMDLFSHLQRQSMSFFDTHEYGRLISRVTSDVNVFQDLFNWAILGLMSNLLSLVGIMVAMLTLNLRLSLLSFVVIPVLVFITSKWRKRAQDAYRRSRITYSSMVGRVAEQISGVRVVQAFARQKVDYKEFSQEINKANFEADLHAVRLSAIFFPGVELLGSATVAMVVYVGGVAVLGEQLTAGVLVAFVMYIESFFGPIRELANRYNSLQATMIAGERVFGLMDTPPAITNPPDAIILPPIQGAIKFENVTFGYSPDRPVLKNINLDVRPGQMVAFVGPTGAGKSSMIKIMGRFYDILSGRITVDGYDVRDIDLASLRRQVATVLQETFLFRGTVMDNIRYGRLDATNDEVMEAAKAVGAHDFITNLPLGYETEVEEGGSILSVGQKQLLSFARALLADPRILILDEATSSVDTQTEKLIQQALERLLAGRTSFVIAHRLSTIIRADKIVVLHLGEIIEEGTHQELMQLRGEYHRLYTMGFRLT